MAPLSPLNVESSEVTEFSVETPHFCVECFVCQGAVKLAMRKQLAQLETEEEKQDMIQVGVDMLKENGAWTCANIASHLEIDDVIDPADTRAVALCRIDWGGLGRWGARPESVVSYEGPHINQNVG